MVEIYRAKSIQTVSGSVTITRLSQDKRQVYRICKFISTISHQNLIIHGACAYFWNYICNIRFKRMSSLQRSTESTSNCLNKEFIWHLFEIKACDYRTSSVITGKQCVCNGKIKVLFSNQCLSKMLISINNRIDKKHVNTDQKITMIHIVNIRYSLLLYILHCSLHLS